MRSAPGRWPGGSIKGKGEAPIFGLVSDWPDSCYNPSVLSLVQSGTVTAEWSSGSSPGPLPGGRRFESCLRNTRLFDRESCRREPDADRVGHIICSVVSLVHRGVSVRRSEIRWERGNIVRK